MRCPAWACREATIFRSYPARKCVIPPIGNETFRCSRPRRLSQLNPLHAGAAFIARQRSQVIAPVPLPDRRGHLVSGDHKNLLMWIQSIIEALREERRDNTGGRSASGGTASDEDKMSCKLKFMDGSAMTGTRIWRRRPTPMVAVPESIFFGDLRCACVTDGQVVCSWVPSGSGKSTLLRCLNMLEDVRAVLRRWSCWACVWTQGVLHERREQG